MSKRLVVLYGKKSRFKVHKRVRFCRTAESATGKITPLSIKVQMYFSYNRVYACAVRIPAALLFGLTVASCRAQTQNPLAVPATSANGLWLFAPAADTFSSTALLDLRALNEKTAGEQV